jgi:hypothetical protein
MRSWYLVLVILKYLLQRSFCVGVNAPLRWRSPKEETTNLMVFQNGKLNYFDLGDLVPRAGRFTLYKERDQQVNDALH